MINLDDRIFDDVKKPEQMWLLLHLARRIGKNRDCWPKNFTLAKDCGWSENTVQKYKKQLRELNLLTVQKRFVNKKQAANSYLVNTSNIKVYIPLNNIPTQDVGTHNKGTQDVGTQTLGDISIKQLEVLRKESIKKDKKIDFLEKRLKELEKQFQKPENIEITSFDEFWEIYDHKKSKKGSMIAWKKLTNEEKKLALEAVPQYLAYIRKDNVTQCHASTWLNQKRWEDDNSIKVNGTQSNGTAQPPPTQYTQEQAKEVYRNLYEAHRGTNRWKKTFEGQSKSNYIKAIDLFYRFNKDLKTQIA